MNQVKIGRFIAERRKMKNMTQAQLAEKLNITDRAISKWENGRGLPDTSIMLELCSELEISVNELLSGEVIEMNDYNKKAEELLLEMARKEEQHNKKLMIAMWTISAVSLIAYFAVLGFAVKLFGESTEFFIVLAVSTMLFMIAVFIALKFEVDAGYYECKNCHHKFVPTYKEVLLTVHSGTTRYLKCPECSKRTWAKKVLKK